MDPLTLFALANSAVSAVKAGCKLYKDIKGAAGDVKDVLKDLDKQFNDLHKDKPPTVEQKNAYVEERNRVVDLNKRGNSGEHTDVYTQLGEHLGIYYDNYYKCMALFEEEERRSKTEVYHGDASLGKRALQRVLMRKQLEQMGEELRQIMVYESPPELGALYTEVNEMMVKLGKEQKVLITNEMKKQAAQEARRKERMRKLTVDAVLGASVLILIFVVWVLMMLIVQDRIEKYPQLGNGWTPKTEEHRKRDSQPQVWVGR